MTAVVHCVQLLNIGIATKRWILQRLHHEVEHHITAQRIP
jgi:hypothetical protein